MSVQTEEGTFSPGNGVSLYTKTWQPSPETPLKARLVFIHGFSDHCNAYYNLFPALTTHGIAVYSFDQRGWGRSSLDKVQQGDTGPTRTVLSDIAAFLAHVSSSSPSTPLFLMGHSMGGGEAALLLLSSPLPSLPPLAGLLLESPLIALHPSSQPSLLTFYGGRLAARFLPKKQMVQKLESKFLCRDQKVCKDWMEDELCHDTGTLEGLSQMLQRCKDLTDFANRRRVRGVEERGLLGMAVGKEGMQTEGDGVPVWVGHGSEDRVTCPNTSRVWFERLQTNDKEYKSYEGAYHKLHAEPDGVAAVFAKDVADWILQRAGKGKTGGEGEVRSKL